MLCEPLRDALAEAYGFKQPTHIQSACINTIPKHPNCDILIKSQTGSGKTMAFLLPLLNELLQGDVPTDRGSTGTLALIIVPTRELAVQTHQSVSLLLSKLRGRHHWLVSTALTGGDSRKSEKARLRKGVHLVVATPGRLLDHLEMTASWKCTSDTLRWLVVDEADRLMDMGFKEKMQTIMAKLGQRKAHRMVLCSATVSPDTTQFANIELRSPLLIDGQGNGEKAEVKIPKNVVLSYAVPPTKLRLVALLGQLSKWLQNPKAKLVVFTLCCDSVDFIHALLTNANAKSLFPFSTSPAILRLHGSLEQSERINSFKQFCQVKDKPACLICTDVAARGLNLERVTGILQWDAPCDLVDFLHRSGRTGRLGDQETGESLLMLQPSEREYVNLLAAERGVQLKSMKFDPLIEWLRRHVSLKREEAKENDNDDEEIPQSLRAHHSQWQRQLEQVVKNELFNVAKLAYTSTLRAYATHPASEKHIFHVKKLHLGHLAASFGLSQAPTNLEVKVGKSTDRPSSAKRSMPRSLTMSEFDAGDPFADHTPKQIKKRKAIRK